MTHELQGVAERLVGAIAREDEAEIQALTYPQSGFALIYDLWGFPGLRLYSWVDAPVQPAIANVTPMQDGMAAVEVTWDGNRGATLYARQDEAGWRIFDLRPQAGEHVSPAYADAEQRGVRLPWRTDAPDPVEQKLRNALWARQAPLDRQRGFLHYWRLVRDNPATADRAQPEAWAAAVDAMFQVHEGRVPLLNTVADAYGAKKATVKARMEALEQLLPAMRRVEH